MLPINERPANFEPVIKNYYAAAMRVAMDVRAIADALELDRDYFTDKFSHPMALLRGNYYPASDWAGDNILGLQHTQIMDVSHCLPPMRLAGRKAVMVNGVCYC